MDGQLKSHSILKLQKRNHCPPLCLFQVIGVIFVRTSIISVGCLCLYLLWVSSYFDILSFCIALRFCRYQFGLISLSHNRVEKAKTHQARKRSDIHEDRICYIEFEAETKTGEFSLFDLKSDFLGFPHNLPTFAYIDNVLVFYYQFGPLYKYKWSC